MIRVGLVGIGGMGRTHYKCYQNNPNAKVVALCDVDENKLRGDWGTIGLNVDTTKSDFVDLTGIRSYARLGEFVGDPDIDLVDICLPTVFHAQAAIAALKAGKHVICEKPMSRTEDEAEAMQSAARDSGRQLVIAHCLRFWPAYMKAHDLIASGEFGRPPYARFHRSGGAPKWSWNNWLCTQDMSGGAPLDMHIHDVDAALWWFGEPSKVTTAGISHLGLASFVDTSWRYKSGLLVNIHGHWDWNGGPFYHAFQVVMERGTVGHNMQIGPERVS